eukprot:jgi/Mesen1/855/ME000112S10998
MGLTILDLRPGAGFGPFTLGMPMCEALVVCEQPNSQFGTAHIKYCEEHPMGRDIVIAFPKKGFHLCFDPRSQRLRLMEVFDLTRLQLRYAASVLGGPSVAATFVRVYAALGPTFPGQFDSARNIYTLLYPGLAVAFPIPAQFATSCLKPQAELPLELPDGTTPVATRVRLFAGSPARVGANSSTSTAAAQWLKAQPPPLPPGSIYMEEVHARLAEGLHFTAGGQRLFFGSSPQDVWAELGRPCTICFKQVDTMLIHSGGADACVRAPVAGADYVYKYTTRGMDVLFDARTHRVKKMVLHSNCVGHADFNAYVKCNFVLLCPSAATAESMQQQQLEEEEGNGRGASNGSGAVRRITADTTWPHIQEILGDGGRAAIQTRGYSSNPFGPSYVYGFRHVAFEIMKNGHIATMTLFQAPSVL